MKGLLCLVAACVAAGVLLLPHDPNDPDSARLQRLGHPDAVRSLVAEKSPLVLRQWTTGLDDQLTRH